MFFLSLLATGCASGQRSAQKTATAGKEIFLTTQQTADRIEILEATQESWSAGIAGAKGDTEYNIRLRLRAGAPLRFEGLWFAGKEMPVHPVAQNGRISAISPNGVFATDTVIQLHASASAGKPKTLENRVLDQPTLTYTSGGKTYRFSLPPFTRKQTPKRP